MLLSGRLPIRWRGSQRALLNHARCSRGQGDGGGCIAGEQLQDLELNSLSQVVPRFGFSEIRHLVWPLGTHPSPSVVMGGDRTAIILPPCPVTSKQGGVMKRWEGTLSPWAERHWGVLRVLGINLEPSYGLRGRG